MNEPPGIVARLIAYWSSQGEGTEDSDPLCRELARELSVVIPRALLAVLKTDPHRYGEAIEEMIRSQLGLLGAPPDTHRDVGPPQSKPAAPDPGPALLSPVRPLPSATSLDSSPVRQLSAESLPAQPRGPSMRQQGNGNVQFATGNISGGFNFTPSPTGISKPTEQPWEEDLPDPDSPIRILFLGANPVDSSPLRLDQEVREIDRSLTSAALGHRFQLHQKWAVRAAELQSHLLRCKPQILHFSGHGSRKQGIFLEGEDGVGQAVAGQPLARLLGQFNQNLRCVVLNACYSEEQAYAIAQEVDCVVGMSTSVADQAAIRFAAVFYEALAYGKDVRAAFELCLADVVVGQLGQDSVPRLLTRRRAAETIRFAAPA